MKILIISNYKDAYNSVRPEGELFIGLQQQGLEITIMTQKEAPFVSNFLKAGIRIINFHPTKKISWSSIQFIRKELQSGQYDILHLFNSKAISNGNFAAIGLPIKVLAYRGVIGGSPWYNPNSYLKHLHPRIDGITAVSKAVQSYLQKQVWGNTHKVTQFYKGQNLDWYKEVHPLDLTTLNLPKNGFIVSCIANNRTWKGINYLIESTTFLPPQLPIHILLIGRKMDTPKNLKLINQSPYKNQIYLLGYRKDVVNLLAASDVYIQPSNEHKEGLGKAILEAMSLGIPPIVTDTGGPPEFVEDGVSGLVIPSRNPKEIATAILKMYKDNALRKQLGVEAKAVIANQMSLTNSVISLKKIYREVLYELKI